MVERQHPECNNGTTKPTNWPSVEIKENGFTFVMEKTLCTSSDSPKLNAVCD